MKLIYVCGTYVPASGGSEKSIHTLLGELAKKGHNVCVITGFGPGAGQKRQIIDKVPVIRIKPNELLTTLDSLKKSFEPKILLTQLIWSDKALAWAKKNKMKTAYFVRSIGGSLRLNRSHPWSPDLIFSNSKNTQDFVRKEWRRKSLVVYPIVDFSDYLIKKHTPIYITMFNPVKVKGGEIFREIAEKLPGRKFLAVEGWHQLKKSKLGKWDLGKMRAMADAYGEVKMHIPKMVNLSGIDNIELRPAVEDVREIYKVTKILLLPSLWEEASARVIREAMINGIPIIASDTGGTKEIIKNGGVVIKDYFKIENWIKEIKRLDNSLCYKKMSEEARTEAEKFDYLKEVKKVEKALIKLAS